MTNIRNRVRRVFEHAIIDNLILDLEEEFGIEIPDDAPVDTVEKAVAYIKSKRSTVEASYD